VSIATDSSRWLVVGANGMLGTELAGVLQGRDVRLLDLPEVDITDELSVSAALDGVDTVVNCAAWTAVDDAETHEAAAYAVNAVGPANLARRCALNGSRLLHISTDYVFDGLAAEPYPEYASPGPRSAYGRTKLAGEWAVRAELPAAGYVLRSAWLYGAHGPNFVATMAALEKARDTIDVVDDQRGQPTWARDLAWRIVETIDSGAPPGIYHATNSGATTWFGLARRVFELLGADPQRVRPTTTDRFPRPAHRPASSVLGHDRWALAGLEPMRGWSEALADAWAAGLLGSAG